MVRNVSEAFFPPVIFTKLSRCEKRFGKWITMLKIINIMNPVQKQHLFQAIVLKKIEDETGIKSFRFTHLPLLSEEIKLLIIVDLSTYVGNLMALEVLILLDFLFSWRINVFRAPLSSSLLVVVVRPLKWFAADIDSGVSISSFYLHGIKIMWGNWVSWTSARSVNPWAPDTGLPTWDVKTA